MTSTASRPIWRRPDLYILPFLLAYLLAGLLLVTDYGQTADEGFRYNYAQASLQAYQTGVSSNLLDEKGPFYGMLAFPIGQALPQVFAGWKFIDGWHYMTLVSFVIGVFFFYRLCLRLIKPGPALAATLVFSTQPLIWGHAFMNPKDMPFMAFFIASVSLGLEMVDHIFPRQRYAEFAPAGQTDEAAGLARKWQPALDLASRDWRRAAPGLRIWLTALGLLVCQLAASFAWTVFWIKWIVLQAYQAPASSPLGWVFARFAQHSANLHAALYVNKGAALYARIFSYGEIGLVLVMAVLTVLVFPSVFSCGLEILRGWVAGTVRGWIAAAAQTWSGFWKWLAMGLRQVRCEWSAASGKVRLLFFANGLLLALVVGGYWAVDPFRQDRQAWVQASLLHNTMTYFWLALVLGIGLVITLGRAAGKVFPITAGQAKAVLPHAWILLAGCFLGFVSDIRTLGPASGLLVGAYLLLKGGRKAIPALLEYVGIGAIVTYVLWPNLWTAPLQNYTNSLSEAADFNWNNTVLFGGTLYPVGDLPSSFIPNIFKVQLTEGALALMLAGLLLAVIYFWVKKSLRPDLLLLAAWLVAPSAAAILMHSTIYDNARQLIFTLPPLFVVGGLALQFLWDQARARWIFALVAVALVAQGLFWDVRLHPYEYVYYNSLVGGVKGAFRNYELDYWGVSLKADFDYLNKVAPPHATIYVNGVAVDPKTYLRPDLVGVTDITGLTVDYAVVLNKRNRDLVIYPNSKILFRVKRENSILSVVKQIKPGDPTGQ